MSRIFPAACMACMWAALALLPRPTAAQQDQPSFDLAVRAPDPLRGLLEKHLELRRYRAVSDLDDAEIARLVTLATRDARELLATQGYFSPEVTITREPGTARPLLVVAVRPGEATRVASVDIQFAGDIATSADADALAQREGIRSGWQLPPGRVFTAEAWDASKAQATRQLLARRYPAGRIADSLADVDAATRTAGLGLKLDSGPLFHLGPLRVTGLERYDPVLVPRLARLHEGMVYDQEKIVQAQLRLAGSGYFESAFIFVDPDADPRAAPVQVTVREAPLHKLVLGVGFTTDGGPRSSVEHTWNRLPGIGWRAVTKMQLEKKNPFAQTEWMGLPAEDGWRWSVLARGERIDDDRLVTHGQRLRVGRLRSDDHIERNAYLQYHRATVQNPRNVALTPLDTGEGRAISATYAWTGRYFDDLPFPTAGNGYGIELGGGLTLGGDRKPFQRTVMRWMGYRPLAASRLQMRAELGAVIAQPSARVPATELFRTGGDTSVRGYKYLGIGVPLAGGLVGPGRLLAVGSIEWQRPIQREKHEGRLEQTLFLDAGAVADRVGDLHPHVGVGTGLRFRSPVGPIEGAIAWGVKTRKLRMHFTAGFAF